MALPGERWCEVTHRRDRCANLRELLTDSEREWSIDDAITENLDLRELLADYLAALSTADECDTAFNVLRNLTVCDPTVGSGAFLFAALEVLDPLYEWVLDRAAEIHDRGGHEAACLQEGRRHHSDRYWMLKTICLHNLFGVDLMAEAPEIAKLRLFLKLAAQIDDVNHLEPLPDLDFNIKSGNLLVGIADKEDAENRLGAGQLDLGGEIEEIVAIADRLADACTQFAQLQASDVESDHLSEKQALAARQLSARRLADELLYRKREETETFDDWCESHRPFHWFVEFPHVWSNGGFDVVVGNPPYIQKKNVTGYRWISYETQNCPDLYAVCMERASTLLNDQGRFAMIVMHSLCFSWKFEALRRNLRSRFSVLWVSSYWSGRMGLFSGANPRNSIVIGRRSSSSLSSQESKRWATRCNRWLSESRDTLFEGLRYSHVPALVDDACLRGQWAFVDWTLSHSIERLVERCKPLRNTLAKSSEFALGYKTTALYQLGIYAQEPPTVDPGTGAPAETNSARSGWLYFRSEAERDLALVALAGRWGYLWWLTYSDEFDVTRTTLAAFPGDIERLAKLAPGDMELESLLALSRTLQEEMPKNLAWMKKAGVKVGRYNMLQLRHITDEADWLLAQLWGLTREQYEAAGNLRDRMVFGNKE